MGNDLMIAIKLKSLEWLFAGLLALAMLFAAATATAQSVTIAVLTPGLNFEPVLEGLREGLEKLGYRDGSNVKFMIEDSKGDLSGLAHRAAKLVEAKPAVIFTVVTPPTLAAKQATHTIPIVFAGVVDPIQSGLVPSFASSGNNLTGVTAYTAYLSGKRLEVLKAIVPQVRKVLAIVSAKEIVAQISLKQLEEAALKLAVKVIHRDVANTEDLEMLLARRWAGEVDAVFHLPSIFVEKFMERLTVKFNKERLPIIVHDESLLRMGALASYGTDFRLLGVQSAKLVFKVLKGVKPADIPIETPDQLVLTINQSAAKAIALKIPEKILERADRIID
jgi:putative ABC transport system substrate-binding protein